MWYPLSQFPVSAHAAWPAGVVIALAGITFWLAGARFNRAVATLAGVLLGGWMGMELPGWCGWSVSGMGPAVGGAMAMGLLGFLLHRAWIGLGLSLLLAALAALVIWRIWGADIPISHAWAGADPVAGWRSVWTQLSLRLRYLLPIAVGTALFAGAALALFWFRLALVLMYSLGGMSLLTGLLLLIDGGAIHRPGWLAERPAMQSAVFALLVLAGAALQWRQAPKPATSAPSYGAEDAWADEDDDD